MDAYVSLHNHSVYSILDAINDPEDLAKLALSYKMKALALTDHGTISGLPEFHTVCKQVGIKPILGLEAYYVPNRHEKAPITTPTGRQMQRGYHLILLAKNLIGYKHLIALNNIAHTEGFYYVPKIDWETLVKYHEGLICTSACLSSELAQNAHGGDPKGVAGRFKELFGDDYYIEVMDNAMVTNEMQREICYRYMPLGKSMGIKVIPTCDCHYLYEELRTVHDVALCIKNKKALADTERQKYDGNYHLKTPDEMARQFPDLIGNTLEVAEKVEDYDIAEWSMKLPTATNSDEMLSMMSHKQLRNVGLDKNPEYVQRLDNELAVIKKKQFSSYFLATKDIINGLEQLQVPIGWGRGSSGGSLICYLLGITGIDPIQYGLLFERFINESRSDYPDIDIDVPQGRRQEVISWLESHYGRDRVAHIVSLNTLGPKQAIKDVCRVMGMPIAVGEAMTRLVPFETKKWEDLIEVDATGAKKFKVGKLDGLVHQHLEDPDLMITCMQYLIGVPRHVGMHASGIIISGVPVQEHLPIAISEGRQVIQYDMDHVNEFGFLKFDILGLRTLDIIFGAAKEAGIDIKKVPLDDQPAYDLIGRGQVTGIFQLEGSTQYAELCKKMKPTNIKEIFDLVSLNRPGVTDAKQDVVYLNRRAGYEPITYVVPEMESILKKNYGVCIYQEDMMRLAQAFAGYTGVEAENLRRAISKKDAEKMEVEKAKFIQKAEALGRSKVLETWGFIEPAARYSWNMSHACVAADTLISTPKGMKLISQLNPGDIAYSMDDTGKIVKQKIKRVFNNGTKRVFSLRLVNGKCIKATSDHRFLTSKGYKTVDQLGLGDYIKTAERVFKPTQAIKMVYQLTSSHQYYDIKDDKIESISFIGEEAVWDLEMPIYHNYIANGMIVHNCVYGMITYICAYLSANYPLQFFKSLINYTVEDNRSAYLSEALTRGLKLLPPDVNLSTREVIIEGNAIRLGLMSMKGVGDATAEKILTARPFKCMQDISTLVTRPILAVLHVAGALGSISDNNTYNPTVKADEVQVLGVSLGGMAADYADVISKIRALPIHQLNGQGVIVAKVTNVVERVDKKDHKMAFLDIVDVHGAAIKGVIVFASVYSTLSEKPKKGKVYGMAVARLTNGLQITAMQSVDEIRGRT